MLRDPLGPNSSVRERGGSVPGQLGTGGGHGKLDEALAGGPVHVPEANDREPVEQGGEAEGEVVDICWRGECSLLDAASNDGGEGITPWVVQFFQEFAHLPVVRGAGPCLHPQDPARVRQADGQVAANESFELAPAAGYLGQSGAG